MTYVRTAQVNVDFESIVGIESSSTSRRMLLETHIMPIRCLTLLRKQTRLIQLRIRTHEDSIGRCRRLICAASGGWQLEVVIDV